MSPDRPSPASPVPRDGGLAPSAVEAFAPVANAPNVGRSALWSAVDFWTQQFGLLLTTVVVGNIVGPEAIGILTLGQVAVTLMMAFLLEGFADALIQRPKLEKAHFDSAFWLLVFLGCLTGILLAASGPVLASVFEAPQLAAVLLLFAPALPLVGASAPLQGLLKRDLRFSALALRTILAQIAGFATGVFLALEGWGVFSLVWAFLVSRGVDAIMLLILAKRLPGFEVRRAELGEIVEFGRHRVSTQAVGVIIFQIDRLTLGLFADPLAVGLYSISERISTSLTNGIAGVVTRVAFPVLARAQGEIDTFRRASRDFLTAVNVLVFPVFVGLALVSTQVIDLLFTDAWDGAGAILPILALAAIPHASNYVLLVNVNALGRPDLAASFAFRIMVLRLVTSAMAAPFGAVYVALANLLVTAASTPLMLVAIRPAVGLSWSTLGKAIAAPAAAAVAMAVAVLGVEWLLTGAPLLAVLAAMVVTGGITYPAALYLLAPQIVRVDLPRLLTRSSAGSQDPLPH